MNADVRMSAQPVEMTLSGGCSSGYHPNNNEPNEKARCGNLRSAVVKRASQPAFDVFGGSRERSCLRLIGRCLMASSQENTPLFASVSHRGVRRENAEKPGSCDDVANHGVPRTININPESP